MAVPSGEINRLRNVAAMFVQRFPCREGKHALAGDGVFM
jgi:hypothetical protein